MSAALATRKATAEAIQTFTTVVRYPPVVALSITIGLD